MRKLYAYPWLIVAVTALITVFFAFQLPHAELENNNLRFVPPDDPALKTSQWIDSTFGSSFFILVGLERKYGTVFDREFLERIREYTQAIQEISVVKEVSSLLSADYITSDGDAIVVEKLVGDDFSGSPEEIAELKRRLLSWDMYERALFSDDFTATQILIPLTIQSDEAASKEINKQFIQIRDIARETFGGYAEVYVTGMPVIVATVNEAMNADLKLLVPLVVLVVLAILFFSFRGLTPVVLPLLTVLIATVWSVGAMPLFGIKLSVISTVLPVILVAVGSAYGIHVVTHYLNERGTAVLSPDKHRELVLAVVMKIRKPVFLAALTTFVAFVSFCFTPVAPCREFGYFASFGVAAAFAVAITLIPALLIIRGPRVIRKEFFTTEYTELHGGEDDSRIKTPCNILTQIEEPYYPDGKNDSHIKTPCNSVSSVVNSSSSDTSNLGKTSVFLADNLVSIARYKKTILFCTILIGVISVYGLSKLVIDNIMVEYFRADTDIYRSDAFIRRQFGGSKVISIVIEADSPDIILRPDTLAAMDGLSDYMQRKIPNVGKVMGFTDLVKRINQVFNAGESPEGLRPARAAMPAAVPAVDSGFGFGDSADDFGFGNFGFDDTAAMPADSPVDSPPPAEPGTKTFTQDELLALFDRAGNVSRGMSASDLIRELKRQVNYEGASYYEIPLNPQRYGRETPADLRRLIGSYLILLSGNISSYANDPLEPTVIKATAQLRTLGMHDSHAIFREIEKYIAANFPPDVKVTLGGSTMVEDSLNSLVVQSQLVSVIFSIICVFIIITLSNKSLAAGWIGIAPLSISVLINFAVMGFAGIKLNLGTSMVASVSVGVGIDYTIHCLEAYKREYRASNGTGNFLWRTFISSGKAIIINAVSVGAGFAVLFFSRFNMLADLGLLIAITMFSSALVSLTVLPALLAVFKPKFITAE